MTIFLPTTVIRHRLENLKKCSLRGLEKRSDFHFLSYPDPHLLSKLPSLSASVILKVDAPPLTEADHHLGLILIDATWRYALKMLKSLGELPEINYRSLPPHYRTAYPRRQDDCPDPERGLASIEAIYVAYHLMGRDLSGLLDHYHWREEFLLKNHFISN